MHTRTPKSNLLNPVAVALITSIWCITLFSITVFYSLWLFLQAPSEFKAKEWCLLLIYKKTRHKAGVYFFLHFFKISVLSFTKRLKVPFWCMCVCHCVISCLWLFGQCGAFIHTAWSHPIVMHSSTDPYLLAWGYSYCIHHTWWYRIRDSGHDKCKVLKCVCVCVCVCVNKKHGGEREEKKKRED